MMLPEFPRFKPVELSDQPIVEAMIAGYKPYADFNFVELWCWNRGEQGGLSRLNGNLVVRWEDVVTGELFLTFLGGNEVERTAIELIEYAHRRGIEPRLHAVPDAVLDNATSLNGRLAVEEDFPNNDYLLSVNEWATMRGARYKNKRNAINRLERRHQPELRKLDLHDPETQEQILDLCRLWAEQRNRSPELTRTEFDAIENLLELATKLRPERLFALGAFSGGRMIGFSVNEVLPGGFGLGHFAKADFRYEGVYPYMLRGVAQYLQRHGVQQLNIEADLGDPGLAIAKRLCHPSGRLRKFVIAEAEAEASAVSRYPRALKEDRATAAFGATDF